ncbi:Brix domain-containing protein [Irpex lacteus]|nr:Brix domain-containing protein [Irpex lacteus]
MFLSVQYQTSIYLIHNRKPKNARSKRALQAREPKEVEDPRTVIFVKGTHVGERVDHVMKELMALKRPHAISFSKKNVVRPFEDATSLEFWSQKNDASMFVLGQSTKKRPHGLTFVRMYDSRVLDMCEVGVEGWKSMQEFKTAKATPGHKPLLHFASDLFDTHPRFQQLKSLLMDFFNGEVIDSICLKGIESVISITAGPLPDSPSTSSELPKVHIRAYTIRFLSSGTRVPRVELTPMGPSIDLSLRRNQDADPELLKQALKRPKIKKQDIEKGLGNKKKMRNLEVDEMGDLRGRVHIAKQDLNKLQTRKMKGLKGGRDDTDAEDGSGDEDDGQARRKRRRV